MAVVIVERVSLKVFTSSWSSEVRIEVREGRDTASVFKATHTRRQQRVTPIYPTLLETLLIFCLTSQSQACLQIFSEK